MLRVRQTGRVHKGRLLQADLAGIFVHLLGEGFFRTRKTFREDDAGVIAGLHHHALQQVGDLHSGIQRREHRRRTGRCAACAPGKFTDREFGVEGDLSLFERLKHHGKRHQLAHAGGRHQLVGILLEEGGFRLDVKENGVWSFGFDLCAGSAGKAERHRQKDNNDGEFSQSSMH
jgi:hypothetical protein